MSRLCTQTAKHTQRDTITSHAMWYLSTLYCMFMRIATISVQRFEKCSRLQYIAPCTCLCCLLPGALTLLDILKSRQPISSSSHHLKGNECHLIEIGSLSLQRSNIISDVYLLFGAAFSFHTLSCAGLWLPPGFLMQKYFLCFQSISCACCKFSVRISHVRWLVCQLTGCFTVTCVRVKVLTMLLTLSSKPKLSSEPPPHSGLYVSINPCSAPVHCA